MKVYIARGRLFHGGQCNVTLRVGCIAVVQLLRIEWLFAVYTAAETPSAVQGPHNPAKLPFPMSRFQPHVIHGSLDPRMSSPQIASWSVWPFLHSTSLQPTYRHADHTMCDICSNWPHHCTVCMPCGLKMKRCQWENACSRLSSCWLP